MKGGLFEARLRASARREIDFVAREEMTGKDGRKAKKKERERGRDDDEEKRRRNQEEAKKKPTKR
jgi:hypothetical protein